MSIISTITRSIVGARRKRVAITGLRNTGKTVFITSLINHLKDHDPEKFDIDGKRKASINWLDTVSAEDGNEFPYDQYRLRMGTEKRWPRKTGECLQYKCRIQPEHFWCSEILLELRDFPGERFNDAPMYGLNYRKWSDFVLNWLERDDTYAKHSEDYRNLLDKAELSEEEILIEYKRTLAKLTMAYKPLISPSTFLLDLEGTEATNKPIEELVAERHVGVDAGQQFTPLSSRAAETNPAIAEAFQAHYQDYQQQVVNPLVKSLRQCDQLVFLVDIPAILMAGPGMLNDSREALDRLLRAVKDHGGAIVNTLVDLFTSPLPLEWKPGGIRQICFVAAKSDMVTEDDQGNLKHLLEGGSASQPGVG